MKSQAGQCAPVSSLTHGPICQDIAALVIISVADSLFPSAVACVSAPNWEKGQRDSWLVFFFLLLFSFYGHHLFCSPSPKNVFGFFWME